MNKIRNVIFLILLSTVFVFSACTNSAGASDSESETKTTADKPKQPQYKVVDTEEINGVTYDIVEFGSFPQSQIEDGVTVDENDFKDAGLYTYYKGSDGEWYAAAKNSYYKVEPIRWRVLTNNYNNTGKKLLFSEKILINCQFYDYNELRTVNEKIIYPNNYEYSKARAFLNGLSYYLREENQTSLSTVTTFENKGFLQTAFNSKERKSIVKTSVINDARNANPDDNEKQWDDGENKFASEKPTIDKIFLLSEQEVTKSEYGFDIYKKSGRDCKRVRKATAFAKANGAYQASESSGFGGSWWLRSPYYSTVDNSSGNSGKICYQIFVVPDTSFSNHHYTPEKRVEGLVPALCIE